MRTFFTLVLLMGWASAISQVPIEVKVEDRPSSMGIQPAFEVVVPLATPNEAVDLWKKTIIPAKLLKKTAKMQKVKDEWIVNNILISDITLLPLNVFTQVSSFPGNIYIRIFLQSEGGFLGSSGSSPETTDAAAAYIRKYAVELYRQAVSKELREEEKKLKALENNLAKLHRRNKSYSNKIEDALQDEKELRNEARETELMLKDSMQVIQLEPAEPGKKTVEEQLQKEIRTKEKEIDRSQKAQTKYSRKVSKNEQDQKNRASEIEKQKVKLEEVKAKLDNIR